MMNRKKWEWATVVIWSMNNIIRSLNDEDAIEPWLMCGVPDGSESLEEIRDCYPLDDDEEFDGWFNELSELFCKIICGDERDRAIYADRTAMLRQAADADRLAKKSAEIVENLRIHLAVPTQSITMNRAEVEAMVNELTAAVRVARGEGGAE